MKKIQSIARTFLISSVFLFSATAVNASTTTEPQPYLQTLIQSLELTEEQKSDVFTLIDEYQASQPEINTDNAIAAKKQQIILVTQPKFDDAATGELISKVQAKEKEFLLRNMRLKNNIYNILTEEQKEKFKSSIREQLMGTASQ